MTGTWSSSLSRTPMGAYESMFPELDSRPIEGLQATLDYGLPGGLMDDPDGTVGDNPNLPAAYGPFGQFLTHDVAFDSSPMPYTNVQPGGVVNSASPRLDLDNVYGGNVTTHTHLYELPNRMTFALGAHDGDMPRMPDSTVIAPDPRDDNNMPLSQTHLAFMKWHNAVMKALLDGDITTATGNPLQDPPPEETLTELSPGSHAGPLVDRNFYNNTAFRQAQRLVCWHYQWIVLHDYLPRICDNDVLAKVIDNGATLFPGDRTEPYMPIEFSVAAFRAPHAHLRSEYQVNADHTFPLFSTAPEPGADGDRVDLRGGIVDPDHAIDWRYFLPLDPNHAPQYERLITPAYPTPLLNLPVRGVPGMRKGALSAEMSSLAVRDLCRGEMIGLPSGRDVAKYLDYEPLTDDELGGEGRDFLLYYLLKEAQVRTEGRTLGPVGSRIVAEVLVGLIDLDPWSWRTQRPDWTPTLASEADTFSLVDVMRAAETGTVSQVRTTEPQGAGE